MFYQDTKPDKILLYLSSQEFPKQKSSLPLSLRIFESLSLIEIHFVEPNYKAYKKLIYALADYPDAILVTIDDDQFYDATMLTLLLDSYYKYPQAIHCHCADAKLLNKLLHTYIELREDLPFLAGIPIGVGGILYPPHSLHPDIFLHEVFTSIAPIGDDLWFFAMSVKNHTPKVLVKNASYHPKLQVVAWEETPNLWDTNITQNSPQLEAIFQTYPEIKTLLLESITTPNIPPKT
ncbi:hypothetical protein LS68_003285 [Helicobacter sp. MIT 05-5293]|uniref:hypothetical protein n=1 Tax=Helicobacter sp. MIT 05-5293 TaxID=1548149 RepID=UPI00068B5081|nr:hypothetical protein [Helicobacter sp. MIT 05-5293]TLD82039.1 hypothetical protein LS68_003285 [Helicobacter sp. MIT 05-5293]